MNETEQTIHYYFHYKPGHLSFFRHSMYILTKLSHIFADALLQQCVSVSGRLMSDEELDAMLNEIGGTCNFDNLLKCLETKMAGDVNDPDDIIVEGIRCHDEESMSLPKSWTHRIIDAFSNLLLSL
jgi:hypothetical protein